MKVSKKLFIENVSEFVWATQDLKGDGEAFLAEPINNTYTSWLEEWVVMFNKLNEGFQLKLVIENEGFCDGYRFVRITPKQITYPQNDNIEDEEYELDDDEAGVVSNDSCCDEEE